MNEEISTQTEATNYQAPSGKHFPDAPAEIKHDHAYEDFKASQSIEGLPPGEVADKMELYETQYKQWCAEGAWVIEFKEGSEYVGRTIPFVVEVEGVVGFWQSVKALLRRGKVGYAITKKIDVTDPVGVKMSRLGIIELASDPLRIFRVEIKELALAYATLRNREQALLQQADIGRAHIKSVADYGEFRKFLQEFFEDDLAVGTARGVSLYQIAKEILLETEGSTEIEVILGWPHPAFGLQVSD